MGQAHWKDWAETYRRICFVLEGYVSCSKDMFRGLRIEGHPSWSFESFELYDMFRSRLSVLIIILTLFSTTASNHI